MTITRCHDNNMLSSVTYNILMWIHINNYKLKLYTIIIVSPISFLLLILVPLTINILGLVLLLRSTTLLATLYYAPGRSTTLHLRLPLTGLLPYLIRHRDEGGDPALLCCRFQLHRHTRVQEHTGKEVLYRIAVNFKMVAH